MSSLSFQLCRTFTCKTEPQHVIHIFRMRTAEKTTDNMVVFHVYTFILQFLLSPGKKLSPLALAYTLFISSLLSFIRSSSHPSAPLPCIFRLYCV